MYTILGNKLIVAIMLMITAFALVNLRRIVLFQGEATTVPLGDAQQEGDRSSLDTEAIRYRAWNASEERVRPSGSSDLEATVANADQKRVQPSPDNKQVSTETSPAGDGERNASETHAVYTATDDNNAKGKEENMVRDRQADSSPQSFSLTAEGDAEKDVETAVGAPNTAGSRVSLSADAIKCKEMMRSFLIDPGKDWGLADKASKQQWLAWGCDGLLRRMDLDTLQPDCTDRPSKPEDPLIAVCVGSTTRRVKYPDEESLALFRHLLPSLSRTVDCGFNYLAVIGYDVGDTFFDNDDGRNRVALWFEKEISGPSALRGLNIRFELVRVPNKIDKPGPVFTAITKVAYSKGADYIYRLNDDSEMLDRWPRKFVNALEAMGPPYGVVGPDSHNRNILVHDFTHRLHMDIFQGQYYPVAFTDWYLDDWISRVYGEERTVRAKNCVVTHHVNAHGQRYVADRSKLSSLKGLVIQGAARIASWAMSNGHEDTARKILGDPLIGRSATHVAAKNI